MENISSFQREGHEGKYIQSTYLIMYICIMHKLQNTVTLESEFLYKIFGVPKKHGALFLPLVS